MEKSAHPVVPASVEYSLTQIEIAACFLKVLGTSLTVLHVLQNQLDAHFAIAGLQCAGGESRWTPTHGSTTLRQEMEYCFQG